MRVYLKSARSYGVIERVISLQGKVTTSCFRYDTHPGRCKRLLTEIAIYLKTYTRIGMVVPKSHTEQRRGQYASPSQLGAKSILVNLYRESRENTPQELLADPNLCLGGMGGVYQESAN